MKRTLLWTAALALSVPVIHAQNGGQAEVAVQGYYLRTGNQLSAGTTGVALKFDEFLPKIGLLRGNFEGYRSGGSLQPADNYLQLRGLIWQGLRWNINAGDFRASGSVLRNPFTNLFFPEITARGIELEAGDSRRAFSFYYGKETILAGPRIPFRVNVPQQVMGASARQTFGKLEAGVRVLYLVNSSRDPGLDYFFPAGRDFRSTGNLTFYSAYKFHEHFRWYGEATAAHVVSAGEIPAGQPLSYFFGPAWESPRLTLRANYASLTRSYFPLAGYWIGDRRGPFGEFRVRPLERLEFFGSANRYETASKPADQLPRLSTDGTSAGLSFEFPLKVNLTTQVSTASFRSSDPLNDGDQRTASRQVSATLSRRIGSHTLRFTGRDMRLAANGLDSREKSVEAEDTFQFRHIVVGGGVRAQRSAGTDRRNAVYLHGSAQVTLGRLTVFGFFESGKDLANQTVFATNNTNSAVVNASLRVSRRWSVQGEAFRSRLISEINPENLFVQADQNLALSPILSRFNQWSFLFRIARTLAWGAPLPPISLDQFTAQRIPITGTVEGTVRVVTADGALPAPGVTIFLESGRSAITDGEGRYRLPDVPEGSHVVSIDMERLPADYNPGPKITARVTIGPRKVARADFDLYNLAGFGGKVAVRAGSEFETLEGIAIRLEPGGHYTTTRKDGSFAFYNLAEGAYLVRIDEQALPREARVSGDPAIPVVIRTGVGAPAVRFEIERQRPGEKPVRKVFERVLEVSVSAPANSSSQKTSESTRSKIVR